MKLDILELIMYAIIIHLVCQIVKKRNVISDIKKVPEVAKELEGYDPKEFNRL